MTNTPNTAAAAGIDLNKLEALTRAVPEHLQLKGWYVAAPSFGHQHVYADDFKGQGRQHIASLPAHKTYFAGLAEFIAAANPATVLELIALARAAQPAPESALRGEVRAILTAIVTTGWPDTLPTDPDARAVESTVRKLICKGGAQPAPVVSEQADERALFKVWWAKLVPAGSDSDHAGIFAFEVWQAGRASLQRASNAPVELLPIEPTDALLMACGWESWNANGYVNRGTAAARYEAIRAAALFASPTATPASAQPADATEQAALDVQLRQEVVAMYQLLDDGEWAEHVAVTPHGQCLETAITRLVGKVAGAQPVAAAPAGYKLAPIVPTDEMVAEGFEAWPDPFFSTSEEWAAYEAMTGCQQAAHRARLCWAAMLAAAPGDHVQEQRKSAGGAGAVPADADLADREGGHHD